MVPYVPLILLLRAQQQAKAFCVHIFAQAAAAITSAGPAKNGHMENGARARVRENGKEITIKSQSRMTFICT